MVGCIYLISISIILIYNDTTTSCLNNIVATTSYTVSYEIVIDLALAPPEDNTRFKVDSDSLSRVNFEPGVIFVQPLWLVIHSSRFLLW